MKKKSVGCGLASTTIERLNNQYRSYVVYYGYDQDVFRADADAAGASPALRQKRMEQLPSEPTLPNDFHTQLRRGR